MSLPKKGLGRGLSALIPGASEPKIEKIAKPSVFELKLIG